MKRTDCPSEAEEALIRAHLPRLLPNARLLIELGFELGLRISELLSLKVGEVWQDNAPAPILRRARRQLKGGRGAKARSVKSRVIPVNARAAEALVRYFAAEPHRAAQPESPLFIREDWRHGEALCRHRARLIVRRAFQDAGLSRRKVWATHSLRKRFVRRIYDRHGIMVACRAVGHSHPNISQRYLMLDERDADSAVLLLGFRRPLRATLRPANQP